MADVFPTTTLTLAAFLEARLDEMDAKARGAIAQVVALRMPHHHSGECADSSDPCPTLRALAQVWASDPAFDPAWSA